MDSKRSGQLRSNCACPLPQTSPVGHIQKHWPAGGLFLLFSHLSIGLRGGSFIVQVDLRVTIMCGGALWRHMGLKRQEDMSSMKQAWEGLQNGTYKSCPEAATAHGLNRLRVWRWYTGRTQSRSGANKHKQRLTDEQEEVLASWVVFLALAGFPASYKVIKQKAILISGGWKPSWSWLISFFKHHPYLTTSKGSNL
jgi:hypothetical protein